MESFQHVLNQNELESHYRVGLDWLDRVKSEGIELFSNFKPLRELRIDQQANKVTFEFLDNLPWDENDTLVTKSREYYHDEGYDIDEKQWTIKRFDNTYVIIEEQYHETAHWGDARSYNSKFAIVLDKESDIPFEVDLQEHEDEDGQLLLSTRLRGFPWEIFNRDKLREIIDSIARENAIKELNDILNANSEDEIVEYWNEPAILNKIEIIDDENVSWLFRRVIPNNPVTTPNFALSLRDPNDPSRDFAMEFDENNIRAHIWESKSSMPQSYYQRMFLIGVNILKNQIDA